MLYIFDGLKSTNPVKIISDDSVANIAKTVKELSTEKVFNRYKGDKEEKKKSPCYIAYNPKMEGDNVNYTLSNNVQSKQIISLDIDCGIESLEYEKELKESLFRHIGNIEYFSYPSYSYREKGVRFRVILSFDKPLDNNQYKRAVDTYVYALQRAVTKDLEKINQEQKKGWTVNVDIDSSSGKGAQRFLFGTASKLSYEEMHALMEYRENDKNTLSADFCLSKAEMVEEYKKKKQEQGKQQSSNKRVKEIISPVVYLPVVERAVNNLQNVSIEDTNIYTKFKIKIFSDFYVGAIIEDTVYEALDILAGDNEEYKINNHKQFETERKNFSDAVKSDEGFRAEIWGSTSDGRAVARAQVKVPIFEGIILKEKTRNNMVIDLVPEIESALFTSSYVEQEHVIYDPNSIEHFRKKDKAWLKINDLFSDISVFKTRVIRAFLDGEIAFKTSFEGEFDVYDINRVRATIPKDMTVKSFQTKKMELQKDKTKERVISACSASEASEPFMEKRKSIYDVMNFNAISVKNGTLIIDDDGTIHFHKDQWNEDTVIYIDQNFELQNLCDVESFTISEKKFTGKEVYNRFCKNPQAFFKATVTQDIKDTVFKESVENSSNKEDPLIKRFGDYVTWFCDGDEQSAFKLIAYCGMCAFPKRDFSQKIMSIKSQGGSGKTSVALLFAEIYGRENYLFTKPEKIFGDKSQFNQQKLVDKTFVVIDEARVTPKTEPEIKRLTGSNGYTITEKKGENPAEVRFFANYLLATNEPYEFKDVGESQKRRYAFLTTSANYNTAETSFKQRIEKNQFKGKNGIEDDIFTLAMLCFAAELRERSINLKKENGDAEGNFMTSEMMKEEGKTIWRDADYLSWFISEYMFPVIEEDECDWRSQEYHIGETVDNIYKVAKVAKIDRDDEDTTKKWQRNKMGPHLERLKIPVIEGKNIRPETRAKLAETCTSIQLFADTVTGEDSKKPYAKQSQRASNLLFDIEKVKDLYDRVGSDYDSKVRKKDWEGLGLVMAYEVANDLNAFHIAEEEVGIEDGIRRGIIGAKTQKRFKIREEKMSRKAREAQQTQMIQEPQRTQTIQEPQQTQTISTPTEIVPQTEMLKVQQEYMRRRNNNEGATSYLESMNLSETEIETCLEQGVFPFLDKGVFDDTFLNSFCQPNTCYPKPYALYLADYRSKLQSSTNKYFNDEEMDWGKLQVKGNSPLTVKEEKKEEIKETLEEVSLDLAFPSKSHEEKVLVKSNPTPIDEGYVVSNDNPLAQASDDPFDIRNNPNLPF